jgi:hypothetical protein
MASNTARAAHRGDGGDPRNSQSGRADGSENRRSSEQTQLVATVAKNGREEYRVCIRHFNGVAKCEIRVFELDAESHWRPTPRAIVIPRISLAGITAALCEVEQWL